MSHEGGEMMAPGSSADFVSFPEPGAGTAAATAPPASTATSSSSSSRPQKPALPSISEARSQAGYRSVSAPPALRREHEFDDTYRAFPDADDYERDRT